MFDRVSQPSAIDVLGLGTLDLYDLRDSDDEVLLRSCFGLASVLLRSFFVHSFFVLGIAGSNCSLLAAQQPGPAMCAVMRH